MALDTVGILTPIDFAAERPTIFTATARRVFISETPLVARLRRFRVTDETYKITSYDVRGRAYTVGTGGITNVATSLPIVDASPFMVGDVLEIVPAGTGVPERVEVTAAPTLTTTPNTLTIRRGREGTTGAAAVATDPITLIGNARTGAEIDQQANRIVRTYVTQNVQTGQYPVQVGGKAQAISGNTPLPGGAANIFGFEKAVQLLQMMRDFEFSMYYGLGEAAAAAGDRPKMKGLKALIKSANVKTNGGASYTKASFIADTVSKINAAGGSADTVLVGTGFLGGLGVWSPNLAPQRSADGGSLGLPVDTFVFPLNTRPVTFVQSLQLDPNTAIVLSSEDLAVAEIRPEMWNPRGNRGDAIEGEWLADLAIHLEHPAWHAWVSGITSFA